MRPLRIVVLGYIVRGPLGGMVWHYLQYAMGFKALGHDVLFLEDSGDDAWSCYNPLTGQSTPDPAFGLDFAARAFASVGMADAWAYHDAHTGRWLGPAAGRALSFCRSADLVVNVSIANALKPWVRSIPCKILIDTDPAFTQIRNLTDPKRRALVDQHDVLFSFGENIGRPGCGVPDDGHAWRPTRQPVVLDAWEPAAPAPRGSYTTVMLWQSYPVRVYLGRTYGVKADSFAPIAGLPRRTGASFEIAMGSAGAPRAELERKGWRITDPFAATEDPVTYREYICRSKAEFSVAKHGYVVSRSGWFSERSAVYLACGRPIVLEDTGFTDWLPTGEGVLAFSTEDDAVAAIQDVEGRYDRHCRAAREIAAEYFDARRVLTDLLEAAAERHSHEPAGSGIGAPVASVGAGHPNPERGRPARSKPPLTS